MSQNKRRRHSPPQIVEKLKEADRLLNVGHSLGRVLQAVAASEAKRLKELEQENTRLKKLLADAHLDKDILKSALDHGKRVSPTPRREAVAHVRRQLGTSERRTCRALGQPRSTQRYARKRKATGGRCSRRSKH